MGSRYYSPNSNRNDNSPSGVARNRMQGRPNASPNWQSPPWGGQNVGGSPGYYQTPHRFNDGPRRGGWKTDYKPWRGGHNSPNSPNMQGNKSFNHTPTPHGQQRLSFGNNSATSSDFIPLPASRNFPRHYSPYSRGSGRPYRGNKRSFGQRPWQRSSLGEQPIENFFKESMLENPWAVFSKKTKRSPAEDSREAQLENPKESVSVS